jgi:NAD-dependent deacetylase
MNPDLLQAAALIRQARYLVALTGAGVSTPSGIPDFRSPHSGLWEQVDPMEVASLRGFRANPREFYEWVKPLARAMRAAQPNPAHWALAQLEQCGKLAMLITQNIDLLHSRAGSQHVLEIHGHLREATCIGCYKVLPAEAVLTRWLEHNQLPVCPDCGGALKPNVILFGEQLPALIYTQARQAAKRCDVMLVAGSSLEVFPAAELPTLALQAGAQLIIINQTPTDLDAQAAVVWQADVASVLPALVDEVTRVTV